MLRPATKPTARNTERRAKRDGSHRSPGGYRVEVLDAARGFAITMMIAYHFCFDLTYYGWADWRILDDAAWIDWRTGIVTSFLFLVGVSLALRDDRERQRAAGWLDRAFLRRWTQIAAAAALVTAGSWWLLGERFIYFGVLHFTAVALWICRRAARRPWLALATGLCILIAGNVIAMPSFDPRWIDWIGFAAVKPLTDDYVPLFPWLGVTLMGCTAGAFWMRRGTRLAFPATALWRAVPPWLQRNWARIGRWSLTIYLLHQPILLALLGALREMS